MGFCSAMYANGGNGTKAASLATSSQMVSEFCVDLNKRKEAEARQEGFNDALSVFQFVIARLDEAIK